MSPGRGSQLRAAGLFLSCLATILLSVSAATEFWLHLWVLGIVIHRGLWKECLLGACALLHSQPGYVGVSKSCMVLAILAGYLSVLCGALVLARCPDPRGLDWAHGATVLCFVTGALAGTALACFMGGSSSEAGGSWAWSLAVGWAAVPVAGLAVVSSSMNASLSTGVYLHTSSDDYVQATRAFLILAFLASLITVGSLLISMTYCVQSPANLSLVSSITAFAAGIFALVTYNRLAPKGIVGLGLMSPYLPQVSLPL